MGMRDKITRRWTCHNTSCYMWAHTIKTTDVRPPKCEGCGKRMAKA